MDALLWYAKVEKINWNEKIFGKKPGKREALKKRNPNYLPTPPDKYEK